MRILRGLSSRFLSCGCLAGIYETYDGGVVAIIDARSKSCADPAHVAGNIVPGSDADLTATWLHPNRSASQHE
jgi:hypothetical protein